MRSIIATTYEIDDLEKAVDELVDKVLEGGPFPSNSIGILFCDSEVDHQTLLSCLRRRLNIDIVGATAMSMLDSVTGFSDMMISLMVMGAEDVKFAAAVSEPITKANDIEASADLYKRGEALLGERPKLIFLFPSGTIDVLMDDYIDKISELSGGVPIYGGASSRNLSFGKLGVFYNDDFYADRMVILMVGGNIKPIFAVGNVIYTPPEQKNIVTRSSDNVVYEVDNIPFVDYLHSLGLDPEKLAADPSVTSFVSPPLLLDLAGRYGDEVPFVRVIKEIDLASGSGSVFGRIPEGAVISAVTVKRNDLKESTQLTIREIFKRIELEDADSYHYSTIMCISCMVRAILLASDRRVEGNVLVDETAAAMKNGGLSLNSFGFYACAEICPTSYRDGLAVNRVHNESIVLCAF